ncbi:MAG: hypothetical protein LBD75_08320 [Candidatus Peribacteria bacterium]|nr:hypothetical protein [Candidatus Peribacteria bacterium]
MVSTLGFVGNVKTFFLKTVDPMKLHSINSFPALFEPLQVRESSSFKSEKKLLR